MLPQALCYGIHIGGKIKGKEDGLDAHYVQLNSNLFSIVIFPFCLDQLSLLLIYVFPMSNYRFFTSFFVSFFSSMD